MSDHLETDKDRQFVTYRLLKIDHTNYTKMTTALNKLFPSIQDESDRTFSKILKFDDLNYKLNPNEDLIILPETWIDNLNCDGHY